MMKTKIAAKGMSFVLAAALVLSAFTISTVSAQAADTTAEVSVEVTYGQTEARTMLEDINELRTSEEDAWYWNSDNTTKTEQTADELTYDYGLEEEAMQRAAEIAISFSHTRPNGTTCFTALSVYGSASIGENIAAGQTSADSAFVAWAEEDEDYSGQGHRRNMLSTSYKYVGIGHVYYQGVHYWVQEFSSKATSLTSTTANDSLATVNIEVLLSDLSSASTIADADSLSVDEGSLIDYPELTTSIIMSSSWPSTSRVVTPDYTYEIADTDIAVLTDDGIQGVAYGTTTLTVTSTLGTTLEIPVTVNCVHTYDSGTVTTEPTCTETGIRTYTCTKCGEIYTEMIAATGHTYDEGTVTDPTCTESGYTTYTCSVCGDTYVDDETAALGHSYVGVVTEPTCTETGYMTYTCIVCGDIYSETIEAVGHSYTSVVTAPTCTEDGYTTYTCSVCGDTYTGDETAALGHSYVGVVTEPTCTETGYTTYTCSVCGDTYTGDETAASGHTEGEAVVTTTDTETMYSYYCTVCGELIRSVTEATGDGSSNESGSSDDGSSSGSGSSDDGSSSGSGSSDDGSSGNDDSDGNDSGESGSDTPPVTKQAQKITVKSAKTKTIKYTKLKKKKTTFKLKASAKGKVTYAKKSGNKKITVSKAGKVTVKKGLKKGNYKIKVKISAAATGTYKKATKTVTFTIKVK